MENNVVKVWFDNGRIFIRTAAGEEKNHPLSWFPKLQNSFRKFYLIAIWHSLGATG